MRSCVLALLAACGSGPSSAGPPAVAADEVATPTEQAAATPKAGSDVPFPDTCKSIADDIERLARQYPQLNGFRATDQRDCTIRYQHATHAPTGRGGWSSGVPQPDPDGVWLYIGIYDPTGPDAQRQIHTQPVVPSWWIGNRKVMFLILEGENTARAAGAISKVLEHHGLVTR